MYDQRTDSISLVCRLLKQKKKRKTKRKKQNTRETKMPGDRIQFSARIGFITTTVSVCLSMYCRRRAHILAIVDSESDCFFLIFLFLHHSLTFVVFFCSCLRSFLLSFALLAFSGHVFRRFYVCILQTQKYIHKNPSSPALTHTHTDKLREYTHTPSIQPLIL